MKNKKQNITLRLIEVLGLGIELSERNGNNGSESQYFRAIARRAIAEAVAK